MKLILENAIDEQSLKTAIKNQEDFIRMAEKQENRLKDIMKSISDYNMGIRQFDVMFSPGVKIKADFYDILDKIQQDKKRVLKNLSRDREDLKNLNKKA